MAEGGNGTLGNVPSEEREKERQRGRGCRNRARSGNIHVLSGVGVDADVLAMPNDYVQHSRLVRVKLRPRCAREGPIEENKTGFSLSLSHTKAYIQTQKAE